MIQAIIDGRTITLSDTDRQPCEIWCRVMGYYRPVQDWNIGKRKEHEDRIFFRESTALTHI